jgi:uncharacterized protein (DUF983 family)
MNIMSIFNKFVRFVVEHKKGIAKVILCFMVAGYVLFASWITSDSLYQMLAIMIFLVIMISIGAFIVILIRIISDDDR